MIHITKYLVSIKLHFVCFLIGFLLFMNIFYFYLSSTYKCNFLGADNKQ